MTDQEKIERLAKWLGRKYEKRTHVVLVERELGSGQLFDWRPLTQIADAWMLIEKTRGLANKDEWRAWRFSVMCDIVDLSASEAARTICEAILEAIE